MGCTNQTYWWAHNNMMIVYKITHLMATSFLIPCATKPMNQTYRQYHGIKVFSLSNSAFYQIFFFTSHNSDKLRYCVRCGYSVNMKVNDDSDIRKRTSLTSLLKRQTLFCPLTKSEEQDVQRCRKSNKAEAFISFYRF